MTTTSPSRPGLTAAGLFGDPETVFIPTIRRGPDTGVPFWLFENRDVPLSEQYGIYFEGQFRPLKSRRTAWWLALLLGVTGADRFYLAKPFTGALKLLTAGGAGLWWLVDLFRLTAEDASDGRRAPLAGTESSRRRYRLASAAVAAAVLGVGAGAAVPPVGALVASAISQFRAAVDPPPPAPVPEWVTVADAAGRKPPARVVTATGKLHVTYTLPGPAVVYLQPAKGPALTILTRSKAGTGAIGVTLPPGTYTLTVSTTGPVWKLKAEEFRLPGEP